MIKEICKDFKYKFKSHIPHSLMPYIICFQYYEKMGKKCNLKYPKTYTEKIQWAKINRDNKTLAMFADKLAVREWVKKSIGEEYLIPIIGNEIVRADDFNVDMMPQSFVIKANHGCGYNLVVDDKDTIDENYVKTIIKKWLAHNFAYELFEMQYSFIEPKIYIEENIRSKKMNDLPDYKFFCFDGKVCCLYYMINTYPDHNKAKLGIYDRNFKLLPYHRADFAPIEENIMPPVNYETMVDIAEKLSKGFSHVRVDLYNVEGKIYFGEMTFSTGGGLFTYVPEIFDTILGNQWNLESGI